MSLFALSTWVLIFFALILPTYITSPTESYRVGEVAKEFGICLPTFGHAADGTVHTHIMRARYDNGRMVDVPEAEWRGCLDLVRERLYADCRSRGGVISGEHGIGLVKKPFLSLVLDEVQLELMKGIKRVFDPRLILNPGKIFDIEGEGNLEA